MKRAEIFVLLTAFLLFAFQNCSTMNEPHSDQGTLPQKSALAHSPRCGMVSCLEGFQVNVRLASPVPEAVKVSVDGNVIFDECKGGTSNPVNLYRPDNDSNMLSIFVGQSVLTAPAKFQLEVADQKSCKAKNPKVLMNASLSRDQLHADPSENMDNECECPTPPTLTWDELSAHYAGDSGAAK